MLRRWVAAFRLHGNAALHGKQSRYDARFKLRVLQHMWRDGLSAREVTALYDIRAAGAVPQWARLYDEGGIDALAPRPKGRRRKMADTQPDKPAEDKAPDTRTREELLKENEYLRAEVAYLKKLDALLKAKNQAGQKKNANREWVQNPAPACHLAEGREARTQRVLLPVACTGGW